MLKSTDVPENKKEQMQNDVVDINIGSLKKQRFRINGDNDKILELNTSDIGIITRISELYPKLQKLADKMSAIEMDEPDEDSEKFKAQLDKVGAQFKEIDKEMREYLDELFDTNVSEICAPFGNMYDLVGGQFRYDSIIDALVPLYESNLAKETKALKERLAKKTAKYAPQDRKRTTKRNK